MSRIASVKKASKISPPYRRIRLLDLCKSNMKAHRALCVDRLRRGSNKEQLAREIIEALPPEENVRSCPVSSEDRDVYDDLSLYVENEEYEYLLNGIMEELSEELYLPELEVVGEETDDNDMLCPLCQYRRARVDSPSSSLTCACGLRLHLREMSHLDLQSRLAEEFEHHASWSGGGCPTLRNMFHLEFRQVDEVTLEAFCRTCQFQERVLGCDS